MIIVASIFNGELINHGQFTLDQAADQFGDMNGMLSFSSQQEFDDYQTELNEAIQLRARVHMVLRALEQSNNHGGSYVND